MLYDYIKEHYENGEPIFLNELPGASRDYVRQEMKRMVDEGFLERFYNGVYYRSYKTILGTQGKMSMEQYLEKRYLTVAGKINGYVTGLQAANKYGFTTQNPSCYEICSNEATTKQRKQELDGSTIIVYKPVAEITERNKDALQFLDLMVVIDKYSEITGDELKLKLRKYVDYAGIDFSVVNEYLPLYPDKVYRNIYEGGLMGKLV